MAQRYMLQRALDRQKVKDATVQAQCIVCDKTYLFVPLLPGDEPYKWCSVACMKVDEKRQTDATV